ncbi:hypothetical protein HYZ97_05030 [Candidatus Pacearchaeota archaeon]|nr:hypothetical protein [Candidatus Pacearchaeota archaeon]
MEERSSDTKIKPYGLGEVLKHPLACADSEISEDMTYGDLLKMQGRKRLAFSISTGLLSFGLSSVPHELIHAGVNKLTGGVNKEIVINTLYGGGLFERIIPGITSETLLPFIGGYVSPESGTSFGYATILAPYVMTVAGIALVRAGKKKRNLAFSLGGIGMLAAHCGGIIGDFALFGRKALFDTAGAVAKAVEYTGFASSEPYLNLGLAVPLTFAGFIIGKKVLDVTYRASSAVYNHLSGDLRASKELESLLTSQDDSS